MEPELNEQPSKAYFTHANNITMGHARVIWAPACHPVGSNALCLVVGLVRLDWLLILIATVGFMASLLSHSGSD